MWSTRACRGEDGFTLAEAAVVLVITAMISTGAFSAWQIGSAAVSTWTARSDVVVRLAVYMTVQSEQARLCSSDTKGDERRQVGFQAPGGTGLRTGAGSFFTNGDNQAADGRRQIWIKGTSDGFSLRLSEYAICRQPAGWNEL